MPRRDSARAVRTGHARPMTAQRASMSLVLTLLVAVATAEGPPAPPPAPAGTVVEMVHGQAVADPYRWLERLDDPAVVAWARAQGDYTRALLGDAVAGVAADAVPQAMWEVAIDAGRLRRLPNGGAVFLARMDDDPVDALYTRSADGVVTRAFVPAPTPEGKVRTIAFFVPAPDGRHVALGMGENGSEDNALHVLDLRTGQLIDGPIPGVRFPAISWWPDSRRFTYPRLRDAEPGNAGATLYAGQQVHAHTLGSDWRADPVVFGRAMAASAEIPEGDFPEVDIQADAGLALGRHFAGVAQEFGLYVAPLESLGQPQVPWRRLFGADAGYGAPRTTGSAPLVFSRGRLYLTHLPGKGAIHSIDPATPGPPTVHFADPDAAVLALVPAADGLYLQVQTGMRQRLLHLVPGAVAPSMVRLPFEGQFDLVRGDPRIAGVLLRDRRWTARSRYRAVREGKVSEWPLVPVPPDGIALIAEEVEVPRADGTRVPLSIVHPQAWDRAKPLPFLLTGYAAYGINMRPVFNDNLLPIYRDGIGYAVCHARGGGELGDEWHRAAMKATKHLSWEDFIACAEWLVAQGYARSDRLVAEGASAGGLLVGRAMTERSDLFAGVHLAFGLLNPMRAESHANGAPNVAEFGTLADPDEARWLYDMDTYHHVQPKVAYPAVLLTHGWSDARTPFWMSAKTAARLQAASTSDKPVLMNIDFKGGHQITAGAQSDVLDTKAVIRAFFRRVLLEK
ncbi:prolyl oligopeptidase family serine peptidase [Pseudoxanthomonas beigongshangi]